MNDTEQIYFAIPGDPDTITGGYGYDREIIAGLRRLGMMVIAIRLSGEFPQPSAKALADSAKIFADLPDGATVIIDCLAFGVMDEIAAAECNRLHLIALCHHPLALETGVAPEQVNLLRQSETRALRLARAVLVTSAATQRLLIEDFAVPAGKITLAPPGTRRPQQAKSQQAKSQAKSPQAIPQKAIAQKAIAQKYVTRSAPIDRTPVLLTLATLTRRKGHDTLIAALATIRHLRWRARFVGGMDFDPQWTAWLRAEVAHHGLEGRVEFVGSVQDPTEELSNADIFVLPSRFEGYGMAFAEALAFGLPVVGARAGAVPDLVPPDAGILVSPDQPDELAAALARLLTDPAFFQQLQTGAVRAAQSLTTWEASANTVAGLLRNVSSTRFV